MRSWAHLERSAAGREELRYEGESGRGNYYRSFRHDECLLAYVLNGSSVSGDVTNNIDLPVNGIISQPARRAASARHVYYEARARLRVDGTNTSTESGKPLYPETRPFTPVLHFRHLLARLHFRARPLPLAKCTRGEPRGEVNVSALESLFAKEIIRMNTNSEFENAIAVPLGGKREI